MWPRLNSLVKAMNSVVKQLTGDEVANGPLEFGEREMVLADLSAHVSIINGTEVCVVIVLSKEVAESVTSRWLGKPIEFSSELVTDAAGELLNMIVGSAQRFNKKTYQFGIPVIAKGFGHEVKVLGSTRFERVVSSLSAGEIGLYLLERPSSAV